MIGVELRPIPDPPGIRRARTLPAAWYSTEAHFARETDAVLRREWMCAGVVDEMPAAGSWAARVVAGLPVLFVRDKANELRAFLNVCRHRASPLCEDHESGSGSRIRCPYHSWLYNLDGSLARASGVGSPERFEFADYSLKPVALAQWRRLVFVSFASDASDVSSVSPFDLGPLAAAVDA